MNNQNKFEEQLKILEKNFDKKLNRQFYEIVFLVVVLAITFFAIHNDLLKKLNKAFNRPIVAIELPDIHKA